MNPRIFTFLILIIFISCNKSSPKVEDKPDWVIEEEKMVDIIVDLRIADAAVYINSNSPPRDKTKDWAFIMKKYNIHDSIFRNSHDYYAEHPEVAEAIYEQVIDRISEMVAKNADDQ